MLLIDCERRGRIDVDVLSWIFTETLIKKCFDMSMRAVDRKGKRAISEFINQICSVGVGDVSSVKAQCECLIGAIIVCIKI